MNERRHTVSTLSLSVDLVPVDEYLHPHPPEPVVRIEVDGVNPFAAVRPSWRGWSPDLLFGDDEPLLPTSPPRRVAVQICDCGFPGCGSIAVLISEADGLVHWSDARRYVARFEDGPVSEGSPFADREPVDLPTLVFDAGQYRAEVERATNDRSWESLSRHVARLLRPHLSVRGLVGPDGLPYGWIRDDAEPGWVRLIFETGSRRGDYRSRTVRIRLESDDAERAAAAVLERLDSSPPEDWGPEG